MIALEQLVTRAGMAGASPRMVAAAVGVVGMLFGIVAARAGQHPAGLSDLETSVSVFGPSVSLFEAALLAALVATILQTTTKVSEQVAADHDAITRRSARSPLRQRQTDKYAREPSEAHSEPDCGDPYDCEPAKSIARPRSRSKSAPSAEAARNARRGRELKSKLEDRNLSTDIAVSEMNKCINLLRHIDPASQTGEQIVDTLRHVVNRLQNAGDDVTFPFLEPSLLAESDGDIDNPFSDGVVTAWGLRKPERLAENTKSDSRTAWKPAKPLYAPINEATVHKETSPTPYMQTDSNGSLSPGIDFAELAMPRSPVGNSWGRVGVPRFQQSMHTVVVDRVKLASWDFNPFEATNIDPAALGADVHDDFSISGLPYALQMLSDHGLFKALGIDRDKMKRYLRRVEQDYQKNPYHNRVHALDVMQTCHCVLMQSPALKDKLTAIDKLALLLGAFVHDVGHPGVNNKLLATLAENPSCHRDREKHKERCRQLAQFAITYNSKSILENFHVSRAFQLAFDMRERNANPFADLSAEDFAKLRTLMVSLVLATDMENHFAVVAKVKHLAQDPQGEVKLLNLDDLSEKETLLKAIIHACDVGNPSKPVPLATKWTEVISEEFWAQGDFELEIGLELDNSRLLERQDLTTKAGRCAQAQGQLAFIKYIVKPLHEVLATQLPVFEEHSMKNLTAVVGFWEEILSKNKE